MKYQLKKSILIKKNYIKYQLKKSILIKKNVNYYILAQILFVQNYGLTFFSLHQNAKTCNEYSKQQMNRMTFQNHII